MDAVGERKLIAFSRYGHVMGVLVPIQAVAMLAGLPVDDFDRQRIARHADALLDYLDQENSPPEASVQLGLPAGKRRRIITPGHE